MSRRSHAKNIPRPFFTKRSAATTPKAAVIADLGFSAAHSAADAPFSSALLFSNIPQSLFAVLSSFAITLSRGVSLVSIRRPVLSSKRRSSSWKCDFSPLFALSASPRCASAARSSSVSPLTMNLSLPPFFFSSSTSWRIASVSLSCATSAFAVWTPFCLAVQSLKNQFSGLSILLMAAIGPSSMAFWLSISLLRSSMRVAASIFAAIPLSPSIWASSSVPRSDLSALIRLMRAASFS